MSYQAFSALKQISDLQKLYPKGYSSGGAQIIKSSGYTTPTTGTVLGESTSGQVPGTEQIGQQTEDWGAIINQEYENQMSQFAGQESGLRAEAGTTISGAENEAAKVKTTLGQEQATKEQGVQSELYTGETQAKTASQQARDLFRQTQQSNIAQLSALGISSSSVAEAMAETLGVETARRLSGITGSLSEIRQNATKELGRIKNYFAEKSTQLAEDLKLRKEQIQNALNQGINQINAARNQAATAKAQQRFELFSNAQNIIANLTQNYQQFQQQLQLWSENKAQALTPIVNDPSYLLNFSEGMGVLKQAPGMSQMDITGRVGTSASGQNYGYYNVGTKKDEEDDWSTSPFK